MVPMTATYLGDLRCRVEHGPSGARFVTDAPVDNHGRGEAFSPTDTLCAALATCVLTILGIVARRDGLALEGATIAIEKHMHAQPPRRIGRIVLDLRLPSGLHAEQIQSLERAARTCPVALSIHPDIQVDMRLQSAAV